MFFPRRADVTHFFDFLIPPGVRGKTVVSVPDTAYLHYPESVSPLKRLLLKWNMRSSLRRADRILTASEYMREELLAYYGIPAEKVRVLYNSVDTARFKSDLDPARVLHMRETYGIGGEYILYMGALEPRKNLSRLVDAYARLCRRHGDVPKLVLAGRRGFRHEHLERKVTRLGLTDSVIFCGYVAERDKPYLLAGARLFAFPSLSEGVGAPVLEAMACGTPVLTSDRGALPEICGDGALFVDPEETDSIYEGLVTLLFYEEKRLAIAANGVERTKDVRFSRTQNAEELYRIYQELKD